MKTSARAAASVLAALLMTLTGCAEDTGADSARAPSSRAAPTSTSPSTPAGPRLVALGDSSTTGAGDDEGTGWVQRYADLLERETGQSIAVINRAGAGLRSDALAGQVESDQPLRDEPASADSIVVGTGGADLNAGGDAWATGRCSGAGCYTDLLTAYRQDMDRIATAVAGLRADLPTVFRAVTQSNNLTGAGALLPALLRPTATETGVFVVRSNRASTCAAVRTHGGECIDVPTAFNGPDGTLNACASGLLNLAHCCYASSRGQARMAELLLATGVEAKPLRECLRVQSPWSNNDVAPPGEDVAARHYAPDMPDDVHLADLEVITRWSLAVRGATAPREELVAALQADLDWLREGAAAPVEPVPQA